MRAVQLPKKRLLPFPGLFKAPIHVIRLLYTEMLKYIVASV